MWDVLFWLYLANGTLLIVHEMDSTYWKEWELFRLPGGLPLFLLIHLPLVFLILWGAGQVLLQRPAGLVLSLVLGVGGLGAFCIHTYFIRKGHPEFKSATSQFILVSTLLVSLVQLVVSGLSRG